MTAGFTGQKRRLTLITGAAGGIGRALVDRFVAGGDRVLAHDRNFRGVTEVAAQYSEDLVLSIASELPDPSALSEVLGPAVATYGPVGAVIANAGSTSAPTLEAHSFQTWKRDINLNLDAGYVTVQSVLADLRQVHGSIVIIGSVNGLTALGDPAYSAAKAALMSYTKALAVEYGPEGVRANMICPGTVRTPAWDARRARDPAVFESLRKWYPLRELPDPQDIAEVAWFLCSRGARMVTGVALPVDAGLMAGNAILAAELTQAQSQGSTQVIRTGVSRDRDL